MPGTSSTEKDPQTPGVYWRYPNNHKPAFNPVVFNETRLAEQNLISGKAAAGRGNTFFITLDDHPMVLRHYRRGGLVRRVSSRRYAYTGLSRTRAMLEFDILLKMYDMKLPVPKPYACRVIRHGISYEASIVTHRVQGNTLAHQLLSASVSDQQWENIGLTIARFHSEGIYHADLNAHNILLSDDGRVSLIDFDRAKLRPLTTNASSEKWCVANMGRLKRSLDKVATQNVKNGFELIRSSWTSALT